MELVQIKSKKEKGFTLVEIIVTTFVFSLTVAIALGIFASVIRLQRYNLKQHELLNQTGYAMEYISRAIRMAVKNDGTICSDWANKNYNLTQGNKSIEFATYHSPNECWRFFQDGEILKIEDKNGDVYPLISDKFQTNLQFTVEGDIPNNQPKVTISMTVQGVGTGDQPQITIQTTISQRNLDP